MHNRCMDESFCYSSETITTWLISYAPVHNKSFLKKIAGVVLFIFFFVWSISHYWCFSRPLTCHPGLLHVLLPSHWNLSSRQAGCRISGRREEARLRADDQRPGGHPQATSPGATPGAARVH